MGVLGAKAKPDRICVLDALAASRKSTAVCSPSSRGFCQAVTIHKQRSRHVSKTHCMLNQDHT